jgi:hypothetical protein
MRDAENRRIVEPYEDVWPALRQGGGFTEDTTVNLMLCTRKENPPARAVRPRADQGAALGGRRYRLLGAEIRSAAGHAWSGHA